ncbi:acyltransferase [Shewanella algae]|uniref:acyltransferase n=1 Tax=Shewanella algae TaxID=38313 RepID=UPI0031F56E97
MWIYKKIKRIYCVLLTLYMKKTVKKYGVGCVINGKTILSQNTVLGKNCNFNGLIVRGNGAVNIGDNFHSGEDCLFITDVHNYNGKSIPYDETYIVKNIVVEDNVWIGSRVIILGGVTLGEGSIVQAGSVVVSNVPACSIVGGHPAKVFSQRCEKHYKRKKEENAFF